MDTKYHTKELSQNSWMDPLYLNELLTEEEKSIRKTTKDYCKSNLLPKVIENNKKCFFDKKIYQNMEKKPLTSHPETRGKINEKVLGFAVAHQWPTDST